MKILIAADSFKDALPSFEVCRAIERGIGRVMPRAATVVFPMADGGEGTASVLAHHLGGQQVQCTVSDPLFRPVGTEYFLASNGSVAFIEMAAASGLQLLKTGERNPLETTTFGTGELVLDAMKRGAKKIILGIGGSATNDAGMGMAAALGWSFLSAGGRELSPIGKNLALVHSIVPPPEPGTRTKGARNPKPHNLEVICDVDNPLLGERGAAQVYARQKGADAAAIELLEAGMSHFSKKLANYFGKDFSALPGAGAAGGLGAGAVAFAGATLRPGIDLVMELTEFEKQLDQASLVVTGEGKLDGQTAHNKLIHGICKKAAKYNVPVVAFCGGVDAGTAEVAAIGLTGAIAISSESLPLEQALRLTAPNLEKAAFRWFKARSKRPSP